MKTKTCTKCGIKKELSEFYKDKTHKDGLTSQCKKCKDLHCKKYNNKNIQKNAERQKKYYEDNKESIKEQQKQYQDSHKEERKEYQKNNQHQIKKQKQKYCQEHKEETKEYNKKYRESHKQERQKYKDIHKEELKIKNKKYRQTHRKETKEYAKKYKNFHKKEINKYKRQKRKNDIDYKITCNLRKRIWDAVKGNCKSASTKDLLGCPIEFLKKHIGKQFIKGMNWDNYGYYGWHIDHIKPCALFDLSKPSEQSKCFHYTNLQPLWALDNHKKGNKYKEKINEQ